MMVAGWSVNGSPIDRIRQAIHPTGEQVIFLDDLATASSKATGVLDASCPNQPPLTPLARLDAVERRLEATIRAIESVRPALATLYDSLNDEQKQRLEAIGAEDWGVDVEPRPTVLLAPLALPRFAVTKPLTSQDYLCNALRKS
jgi:LTXXQ motif family protein